MRAWLAAIPILAAVPAHAQEAPLALRRTPALTQRALELGVTAGYARAIRVGSPGAHEDSLTAALELGIVDWLELGLVATVFEDDPSSVRDRTLLTSAGGHVGVRVASTPELAVSTSLDLAFPKDYAWVLTPSASGALVWRGFLLEGGIGLGLAHVASPTPGTGLTPDGVPIAWCRAGEICVGGPIAGTRTFLGGTLAASWIAGAFVPGLRLDASGQLTEPAAPADRYTSVSLTPRRTAAAVHLGPQLEVLLSEHALLRMGLPLAVTTGTQDWLLVASLRVDAELSPRPDRGAF